MGVMQLHMIENRLRLEREIFAGRQEFTGLAMGERSRPAVDPFDIDVPRPSGEDEEGEEEEAGEHEVSGLGIGTSTDEEGTSTDASEFASGIGGRLRALSAAKKDDAATPRTPQREDSTESSVARRNKRRMVMLRLGLRGPGTIGSAGATSGGRRKEDAGRGEGRSRRERASTEEPDSGQRKTSSRRASSSGDEDSDSVVGGEKDLRRRYSLGALRLATPSFRGADGRGVEGQRRETEGELFADSTDDEDDKVQRSGEWIER